jgi:hypothetical protein
MAAGWLRSDGLVSVPAGDARSMACDDGDATATHLSWLHVSSTFVVLSIASRTSYTVRDCARQPSPEAPVYFGLAPMVHPLGRTTYFDGHLPCYRFG